MIGEGEPLDDTAASGPAKLEQATEAVQAAAATVRKTTHSVADAIEAGRQTMQPATLRHDAERIHIEA